MQGQTTIKDLYKIKTIANMTGFNPTLLRAWERRYALLDPKRTPTGHRLYTPEDLRVLRRVRVLLDQGRSIGEIVAQGRPRLLSVNAQSPPLQPFPSGESPTPKAGEFPLMEEMREGILRAALELDDIGVQKILDQAFATVSPAKVLEQLVTPVAQEMGRMWANQIASVAAEHLLTACIQRRLQRLIELEGTRAGRFDAICCGFPDEFHELGSLALTYHLQLLGIHVVYLGTALPFDDLARAIQIRQPRWVLLSVTRVTLLEVHKPALIQMLQSLGQAVRVVVGGSAIRPSDHPELTALGVILWPPDKSLEQLTERLNLHHQ